MWNHEQREPSVEELAWHLYEGVGLENLAERMAVSCGRATALAPFQLMDDDVQRFWQDIARQIIEHSRCWLPNEGCACVLCPEESERLRGLPLGGRPKRRRITFIGTIDHNTTRKEGE